jgi:N-carbamoylputrescine amidase
MPIDKIRKAAIDAHIPLIEEAGQDAYWYDIAEAVPGPTTELMAQSAKTYQMAMVVPVCECYGSSYFVDSRGNVIAMGSEHKNELVVAEPLP